MVVLGCGVDKAFHGVNGVSVDDTCSFSPEPEMLVLVPDISVFSDFNSEASNSNSTEILSGRCDCLDRGSDGVGVADSKISSQIVHLNF